MAREKTWALNLDTVIEYSNMHVIVYTIVAMNHGICYDFVNGFSRDTQSFLIQPLQAWVFLQ